jgi:hypothetical protein
LEVCREVAFIFNAEATGEEVGGDVTLYSKRGRREGEEGENRGREGVKRGSSETVLLMDTMQYSTVHSISQWNLILSLVDRY